MSRFVITGGAGFLGSHLCDSLINDGHEVVCIDNLSTGFIENVKHLIGLSNFEFYDHNILDPLPNLGVFDGVYNLACPASPPKYQANKVNTLMTNVIGLYNVLEAAEIYGAKVFQASTSEVYGDPAFSPQPESYRGCVNTVGPRSCYDEGKRAAETLLTDYGQETNMVTKIVRIFNTYGPRMDKDDGRVVTNFINQALRGDNITIYGDGQQTRSFCYVDDEIRGFRRLMDHTADNFNQPINIGNPGEFTMLELAELVLKLTHSKSKLVFNPLPIDDPKQRKPDITLAKQILQWEPTIDLEEGLTRTIHYFKTL